MIYVIFIANKSLSRCCEQVNLGGWIGLKVINYIILYLLYWVNKIILFSSGAVVVFCSWDGPVRRTYCVYRMMAVFWCMIFLATLRGHLEWEM